MRALSIISDTMDIARVRDYCLSLPHATERSPFGPDTLAMEICGRMFCLMTLDGSYNLKVAPEFSEELRDRFQSIRPGFHMNKRHRISVDFSGDVPDSVQRELIVHSYRRTISALPGKLRDTIDHSGLS